MASTPKTGFIGGSAITSTLAQCERETFNENEGDDRSRVRDRRTTGESGAHLGSCPDTGCRSAPNHHRIWDYRLRRENRYKARHESEHNKGQGHQKRNSTVRHCHRLNISPSAKRHGGLTLLAESPDGCTRAIMLARGFSLALTASLIRAGFAIDHVPNRGRNGRGAVGRVRITRGTQCAR